ncbi:ABC transporter permease [Clostridium sp.]
METKINTKINPKINPKQKVKPSKISTITKIFKQDYQLYLLLLPTIIYFVIFHYWPMYGLQIAFKDFYAVKGIAGSQFVGFKYFIKFFNSYQFLPLIKNTIGISLYQLLAGFPIPIILALLLNQTRNQKYKKFVQTVTYAPHFISVVVLAGMMYIFLSPTNGIINTLVSFLGGNKIFFLGKAEWFKTIYVLSGLWQNTGWDAIIYIAALSSISPTLYEAAKVDGANKWDIICHIDIPSIMPTAIILLILNVGHFMNVGFQKAYLLQNPLNLGTSEIISTYVYKIGLLNSQYSYSTAIGLFNTLINLFLLIGVNSLSKKFSENSLW